MNNNKPVILWLEDLPQYIDELIAYVRNVCEKNNIHFELVSDLTQFKKACDKYKKEIQLFLIDNMIQLTPDLKEINDKLEQVSTDDGYSVGENLYKYYLRAGINKTVQMEKSGFEAKTVVFVATETESIFNQRFNKEPSELKKNLHYICKDSDIEAFENKILHIINQTIKK